MQQTARPQRVIERLAQRSAKASQLSVNCKLGIEPRRRRGGSCSACTPPQEFELDEAVAQLINISAFKRAGVCPYRVVTSHLVAGLVFGPETVRARSVNRYVVDPVMALKGALKPIGTLLRATGLPRDDIEALSEQGDRWKAIYAVLSAERALETALAMFQSQVAAQTSRSQRGRAGALHILAVARAMASAWRVLTGRLPAKDNSKFHDLLSAAVSTIFGHPAKAPNWESATRRAVMHVKKTAAKQD